MDVTVLVDALTKEVKEACEAIEEKDRAKDLNLLDELKMSK